MGRRQIEAGSQEFLLREATASYALLIRRDLNGEGSVEDGQVVGSQEVNGSNQATRAIR